MKYSLKNLLNKKFSFKKEMHSSFSENDVQNDPWMENSSSDNNAQNDESSSDKSYDFRMEKIVDTLLDRPDEGLSEEKENEIVNANYNSFYFINLLVLLLILLIPSFLMRLILLFIIIVKMNTVYTINQEDYKQLHIFYDYEIYIEFLKSLDYNLYKSLNPFFGLMDAHIKSYIRLHGIDLHFYEVYPEVAEWRKRQYEEDFEWVFKRLNRILADNDIVFVYSLDNIKEYGFKYYNY